MKKRWRILLAIPVIFLMSTGFVVRDRETGKEKELFLSCGNGNDGPTQPAEEGPPQQPPEQPDDRPPKD